MIQMVQHESVATRNSCRVCAPLGASMAFLGVHGCMPIIHGGQGCSTYIRRYLIGHFREPVDIASSNFSESSAVFGGGRNLLEALKNVVFQYKPEILGVSTSCLSETMGEDIHGMLTPWRSDPANVPVINVSTPSYRGSHRDGFFAAVLALVQYGAESPLDAESTHDVNLLPGMVSAADLRHLRDIVESFGLRPMLLPDYSQTMDDGQWQEWQSLPNGGTTLAEIRSVTHARATIEFELPLQGNSTAGQWLELTHNVSCDTMPLPIGIDATDHFMGRLEALSGKPMLARYTQERERLVDSYVDAHKYASGLRLAVFGEEEWVVALAHLAAETGMMPLVCATGGSPERLRRSLQDLVCSEDISVIGMSDFEDLTELCQERGIQMMVGNSRGYAVARHLGVPLVRCGFPIQDRMGGPRILHVGYQGTQRLFDEIINTWLQHQQDTSPVGYKTY